LTQNSTHKPLPFKDLDGLPVFAQEWQAQTLAMVDTLITNRFIEPSTWSEAFGSALSRAHASGNLDDMDTYYAVALATLEKLMTEQCKVSEAEISSKKDDWKQAYLRTPHGHPVEL
jgi:nitrile hydratase accessory protein